MPELPRCARGLVLQRLRPKGRRADSVALRSARRRARRFPKHSRIWRSLATLVSKPGRLTRLFIEGQRARYTPPFRMYVVTSVTFFVVFSLVRSFGAPDSSAAATADATAESAAEGAASVADTIAEELNPAGAAEQQSFSITVDDDDLECTFDPTRVSPALRARFEAACERVEATTAGSFNRAFADNFPVTMLVFIPIVAGIMKLLYLLARRKYVEHLLFFVRAHTFFFLVALLTVLLVGAVRLAPALRIPALVVAGAAWLYFLVYLYLAMREIYRQGHALTAMKYVVLGGSYFMAAMFTLLAAVVFTALTL